MKLKRKRKTSTFPIFSMADIAFLLLIFIMLVALINYREQVSIDFPQARAAGITTAERNLEVWIDREGGIYIDGRSADFRTLESIIEELVRTAPDTRIHIIADRYTPYRNINAVLEVLQFIQYRVVSFVVRNV